MRNIIFSLLMCCLGFTCTAGEYYRLAEEAFRHGEYNTCIDIYKTKIPKELKEEKKNKNYSAISIIPLVESYIAIGEFNEAAKVFESEKYIKAGQPVKYEYGSIHLNGDLLKNWSYPEELTEEATGLRHNIYNPIFNEFVYFYSMNLEGFRQSPFIRHIADAGGWPVERSITIAADQYYEAVRGYAGGVFPFENILYAAEFGHNEAINFAIRAYSIGYYIVADRHNRREVNIGKNLQRAFHYKQLGADFGLSDKYYEVAQCYLAGNGVTQDVTAGLQWLEKAAETDHIQAKYLYGMYHYEGIVINGTQKIPSTGDYNKVAKYLIPLMDSPECPDYVKKKIAPTVSKMYRFGRGVMINETKADDYMKIAADLGDDEAKEIMKWLNPLGDE